MTRSIFAAILILLGLGGRAYAETYVSVAPITVASTPLRGPSADMMRELVSSCLSFTDSLAVLERADLAAAADETSRATSGLHDGPNASLRMKRLDYVITGSLTFVEDQWLLSLQANDPATTQTVAAQAATLPPRFYEDNTELCERAAKPLAKKILRRAQNPASPSLPEDIDAETSTLLLQGLNYENNGDHAHAFPYFLKILERNPRNADATCWLAISYAGAGLAAPAQKEAASCLALAPHHPKRPEIELLLKEKSE